MQSSLLNCRVRFARSTIPSARSTMLVLKQCADAAPASPSHSKTTGVACKETASLSGSLPLTCTSMVTICGQSLQLLFQGTAQRQQLYTLPTAPRLPGLPRLIHNAPSLRLSFPARITKTLERSCQIQVRVSSCMGARSPFLAEGGRTQDRGTLGRCNSIKVNHVQRAFCKKP